MKIVVKPIPRKRWHGKEGKESFSRPLSLEVLLDTSTGAYATGLTPSEAEEYSKKLGVDLSSTYYPDKPHPFWGSNAGKIKLPNHTMIFDDTKPMDFVKIKNLKASKFVANSYKEWEDGLFPEAEFYIFDEEEEVEIKATKIQNRNRCIEVMNKMSLTEKTNMVRILSDKTVSGRSQNFIDVELANIIDNKTDEFIKYAKMDAAQVTARAQMIECLSLNILVKDGSAITYMGDRIGADFEQALEYFMSPENQMIKISILEKLEADKIR